MADHVVHDRTRALAKRQRRLGTHAEEALWRDLRSRRFHGFKFRRQCPLGSYVVDFVCFEARLIVELDGVVHEDPAQRAHDAKRDAWLREQGFRILRVSNDLLVAGSGDLALDDIRAALIGGAANPSSDPASPGHLLPQGEKEDAVEVGRTQ